MALQRCNHLLYEEYFHLNDIEQDFRRCSTASPIPCPLAATPAATSTRCRHPRAVSRTRWPTSPDGRTARTLLATLRTGTIESGRMGSPVRRLRPVLLLRGSTTTTSACFPSPANCSISKPRAAATTRSASTCRDPATPERVAEFDWLPETCAYRRIPAPAPADCSAVGRQQRTYTRGHCATTPWVRTK